MLKLLLIALAIGYCSVKTNSPGCCCSRSAYLLRTSTVEAMELLTDKLARTRNNQEFLHNMSSI